MCAKCGQAIKRTNPVTWVLNIPAMLLVGAINLYRKYLSPYVPASCRFTPTCSRYGMDAVRRYGAIKGGWLSVWRIVRCNPFNHGGYDPLL